MGESAKASFTLKEIGPGTDIETYVSSRGRKTSTEVKFTNHLENLLKEGIDSDKEVATSSQPGLTYGHAILAAVVYEKYDMALAELETILSLRDDYPDFGDKTDRYIQHAKSLVRAIKAKRAVGKLPHVSRSKQKELVASLSIHFNELRTCILNIEKVERSVRKADISSTRWFILSLFWGLSFVFGVAAFQAAFPDVFYAAHQISLHYVHRFFSFVVNFLWPLG